MKEYKEILETKYLIPSMRVLLEDIDRNFDLIEAQGIETMGALYKSLKTKKKAEELAETAGIDADYMIVLRRSVSSYKGALRKLVEYPLIQGELENRLNELGLKTSKDLYEFLGETGEKESMTSLNASEEIIQQLTGLMDVTRLRYVSPLFATALAACGYDSVTKVAGAEVSDLYDAITRINDERNIQGISV